MPITLNKDRVRNLTIFKVRGDITTQELRASAEMFWKSPALTLNLIWDLREATFRLMKYGEMDNILFHGDGRIERLSIRESGKTAIVVNNDEIFTIMQQLSSSAAIQCLPTVPAVFKTMGEAMAWIDQTEYDYITALHESDDDESSSG